MNPNDVDKAYISPYDEMIYKFDKTHAKSESQLKEIRKHERIAKLRDHPEDDSKAKIWEDF